jgi:CheY-like chemotaxis protein
MKAKKKVLVVDDEPDNASVFSIGLQDGGFEVDTFIDPLLALAAFKAGKRYDILLLDIKMPDMNGFKLYEEMKKIDERIKTCFLTAFGEGYLDEFRTRFQMSPSASKEVTFIRKPIRVDDLVKRMNEIV